MRRAVIAHPVEQMSEAGNAWKAAILHFPTGGRKIVGVMAGSHCDMMKHFSILLFLACMSLPTWAGARAADSFGVEPPIPDMFSVAAFGESEGRYTCNITLMSNVECDMAVSGLVDYITAAPTNYAQLGGGLRNRDRAALALAEILRRGHLRSSIRFSLPAPSTFQERDSRIDDLVSVVRRTRRGVGPLTTAALAFPGISREGYRPDVAVQVANAFITSNHSNALEALETLAMIRPLSESTAIMRLYRLIFIPNNPTNSLRCPGIGTFLLPMPPSDWPYAPFAVVNDVPLLITGSAGAGALEAPATYLAYCRSNGVIRTRPYLIPTFTAASNALEKLFLSPAWKSLKWEDSGPGWSYKVSEAGLKRSLWMQIETLHTNTATVP